MTDTPTTLEVENLVAGYGGLPIVNGVTLTARPGRVTVVIGPNGCGKSTTLRALGGLLAAIGGDIRLVSDGTATDLVDMSPGERLATGLSYVPQERTGFPDMSVHDNLSLGAWLWRANRSELTRRLDRVYESLPYLDQWRDRPMGLLSGGQQKLVEVGRALMSEPRVIMLDEPTAGVAPGTAEELLALLRRICKRDQVTVLMVEQNLKPALETADYAYSLVGGRNSTDGPAGDVLTRLPQIVESWLWD